MAWDAPICVGSAACADGEWVDATNCYAGGAAGCVCLNAKAQGFDLRESDRRDPTLGLRIGGMAPTSHYGINLQASGAAERRPELAGTPLLSAGEPDNGLASIGGKSRQPYCVATQISLGLRRNASVTMANR